MAPDSSSVRVASGRWVAAGIARLGRGARMAGAPCRETADRWHADSVRSHRGTYGPVGPQDRSGGVSLRLRRCRSRRRFGVSSSWRRWVRCRVLRVAGAVCSLTWALQPRRHMDRRD